jgi:type I restriction enzyme, S subunit
MELKPGYKMTEVGVIPAEWSVVPMADCLTLLTDFEANGSFADSAANVCVYDTPNYAWFVRATDLESLRVGSPIKYVDERSYRFLSKTRLVGGEVLLTKRGEIGKVYRFRNRTQRATLAPNLYLLRLNGAAEPGFIFLYLKYGYGQRALTTISATTTLGALYKADVKALRVPLPEVAEQRKIVAVAEEAEFLVERIENLLTKKRALKQAAMQQLLTGQTRLPGFEGEWKVQQLGEIGVFVKGSGVRKDEAKGGNLPCIRYGEIYTHHSNVVRSYNSWISPQVADTATKLRQGDLLFAGSGETKEEIGKCVAFVDSCEAYAGGDIVILRATGIDPTFMGYYLNTVPISAQKASRGQGDAVVHISATALSGITITIPSIPEQRAIAEVLSDMDAEIEALEARLEKTRLLKQGMVQELLTGRTRLV